MAGGAIVLNQELGPGPVVRLELPDEAEAGEHWRALVPRFEFLLDDLTVERAERLMARPGPALTRLALLLLRYGRSEEISQLLASWTALFVEVYAAPDGLDNLRVVIRYLLQIGNEAAREAIKRFRFKPAIKGGEAVSTEMKYSYTFLLD